MDPSSLAGTSYDGANLVPVPSKIHHHRASSAMTINYQHVYEASRNDAKWKELQERIQGYHKECSEYKQKQRQAFRKVIQFDRLEDLAMDRMGCCEGSEHAPIQDFLSARCHGTNTNTSSMLVIRLGE